MMVLVVEDESLVRELVEEALTEVGASVATASSSPEALTILEQRSFQPDVLVTDINLGSGADGFELARTARVRAPGMKVVYITGHAAHLAGGGVPGSLMFPKPFMPEQLAAAVMKLGGS